MLTAKGLRYGVNGGPGGGAVVLNGASDHDRGRHSAMMRTGRCLGPLTLIERTGTTGPDSST